MSEERGERPDPTGPDQSPADESAGDGGLEPTGGPRRVVSEESVDDVVASLEETKTTTAAESVTADETSRTESDADTDPASADRDVTQSARDHASESRSRRETTDEPDPATVDVDDLPADAGPLAGRLQAESAAVGSSAHPDADAAVASDPVTSLEGESSAASGVDDAREPDEDDDSAHSESGDARDADQPSGLFARIKRAFFG